MTRKEEVGACIEELKKRVPWGANSLPKSRFIEAYERESLNNICNHIIKETQDLVKYIEEYEELDKK